MNISDFATNSTMDSQLAMLQQAMAAMQSPMQPPMQPPQPPIQPPQPQITGALIPISVPAMNGQGQQGTMRIYLQTTAKSMAEIQLVTQALRNMGIKLDVYIYQQSGNFQKRGGGLVF